MYAICVASFLVCLKPLSAPVCVCVCLLFICVSSICLFFRRRSANMRSSLVHCCKNYSFFDLIRIRCGAMARQVIYPRARAGGNAMTDDDDLRPYQSIKSYRVPENIFILTACSHDMYSYAAIQSILNQTNCMCGVSKKYME